MAFVELGFLFAFPALSVLSWAVDKLICKIWQVEPLNEVDKNVYHDIKLNRCIIMGAFIFEKSDEATLLDLIKRKLPSKWLRYRSKMTKVCGNYYFKELS
jgi:hypothetical protein